MHPPCQVHESGATAWPPLWPPLRPPTCARRRGLLDCGLRTTSLVVVDSDQQSTRLTELQDINPAALANLATTGELIAASRVLGRLAARPQILVRIVREVGMPESPTVDNRCFLSAIIFVTGSAPAQRLRPPAARPFPPRASIEGSPNIQFEQYVI